MSKPANTDLFVLGAGRPHRGEQPSALMTAGQGPTLSWIMGAVDGHVGRSHFVGGYHFEEVKAQYPSLSFSLNPDWQTTGSAASLLCAPLSAAESCVVCYGDIVFRTPSVLSLLESEADICVAIDSLWRERYAGRIASDMERCEKVVCRGKRALSLGASISPDFANGEFIGLVRFRSEAVQGVLALAERFPEKVRSCNLSALIELLRLEGLDVQCVDVAGEWAELNEPQDLARFVMGTKAETLSRLRKRVTKSVILDQVSFTSSAWEGNPEGCVAQVQAHFGDAPVVVRSSTSKEDGFSGASAGVYSSVLNVDTAGLAAAVDVVFASYGQRRASEHVLVQPFVSAVDMHGVIFTRTLDRGAPYYVINYDESGSTDAITSGTATDSQTLIVHRDAAAGEGLANPFRSVLDAVRELEGLLHYDTLDIEFAVDRSGAVYIFQVRPIAVKWDRNYIDDEACGQALRTARLAWASVAQRSPFVPGGAPLFGVMPDWNPAEIIGTAPRALSASLYSSLILDDVWATQRAEYGYRDVRPQPLMVFFAGRPYIDVRASFSSFVPAALDDALAGRLVSFYVDWLKAHPYLHDKVEFDVVPTCMSLDFDRWEERLLVEGGFSRDEVSALSRELTRITVDAFGRNSGDFAAIEQLRNRFSRIKGAVDLTHAEKVRLYLDDCRRLGTLPFAHLARSGFVAVTLLRSAESRGILSSKAIDSFMSSLNTVTHEFSNDVRAVAEGAMELEELMKRYGHLRPGTYDITSPCYGSDVETYVMPLVEVARAGGHSHQADPEVWLRERHRFFEALAGIGLPSDPDVVEPFLRGAIAGREFAKFHFTRNLSEALEEVALLGEEWGLSREQLADLPIDTLLEASSGRPFSFETSSLANLAAHNSKTQRVASACPMPALIAEVEDFERFWLMNTQPNFIGTTKVRGDVVRIDQPSSSHQALRGKVVLIPQADPGYDWLFGQHIAALITMYGGANSHMAIRSAEFQLPAAIGVGDRLYAELSKARVIELDPANQRVEGFS